MKGRAYTDSLISFKPESNGFIHGVNLYVYVLGKE